MKHYFTLVILIISSLLPLKSQDIQKNFKLSDIKDGEEDFKQRRLEWFDSLHRCEPALNWHVIDAETRQAKLDKKQSRMNYKNYYTRDQIQSNYIANGRIKGQWIEKGSNNLAGRMHYPDIDFERNLIYAASSGCDVWRGTIEGKDWTCLNNGMKINDIRYLKVLKIGVKNRILVVGNSPAKVYFTEDEGQTWNVASGLNDAIATGSFKRGIYVPSQSGKILILGSEWDFDRNMQITVIYSSTDNGSSFSKIFKSDNNLDLCDIWAPLYETGKIYLIQKDTLSEIGNDYSILKINEMSTGQDFKNISTVYLKGANNSNLSMVTYDWSQNLSLFFSSTDGGTHWEDRGTVDFSPFSMHSFEVSPNDPNKMYCGGVELNRSSNGGINWEVINTWSEYYGDMTGKLHADIMSVRCFKDSNNNEVITICTDGGLYISYDNTQTVHNLSLKGLDISQYYSSYTCRYNTNVIYTGAQDQGFQRCLKDSGATLSFEQTISGDYGHLTSSDGGSTMWAVYPGFALFYQGADKDNIQNTATWEFQGSDWLWMPPIVADLENPNAAFLASGGNNGTSNLWYLSYSGGNFNPFMLPYNFNPDNDYTKISSFASSSFNHDYFYALTSNGKFYVSSDWGSNWTKSENFTGPESHYFYGNCVLPSKKKFGKVFMAGSGYTNSGVYMTEDNGVTFKALDTGLPKTMIFEIAMDKEERFIFAATEVGPYVYSFADSSWYDMSVGDCPDQVFWAVDYIPEIETARFCTYGRGVWDFKVEEFTTVSEQSKNSDASAGIQINVIPNPVSDNSTISFDLPVSGFTTVKIFDIQGRIVGSLFNGIMEAGNHEFNWTGTTVNGTRLPQGDYMCVVAAYGRSWFAKIKLIK
jgi:hypothetical protein